MKKFAGTWVVVGVFAALLAYLLIAKPKGVDEKRTDSLTLTSSKRETIDKIELKNTNGEFVIARVSGGPAPSPAPSAAPALVETPEVWKITSPRELLLEDSALAQMKNSLSDLIATDPVWAAPT